MQKSKEKINTRLINILIELTKKQSLLIHEIEEINSCSGKIVWSDMVLLDAMGLAIKRHGCVDSLFFKNEEISVTVQDLLNGKIIIKRKD